MLKILRLLLVYIWFLGGSALLLPIFFLRPFDIKNAMLWCRLIPSLALKILGVQFEVRNHKRMFEYHPSVIIANHQHALDLIVFPGIINIPSTSIGKKQVLWVPFFGLIYWLSGQILIDRKNRIKAVAAVDIAKEEIIRRNLSVWIFPEGTRSNGRGLGPFKKGAFHLAIQTQRPLLPIVVNSYLDGLDLNRWKSGRVIINILEPISTQGLSEKDVSSLAERARQIILNEILVLDNEINRKTHSETHS